MSTPPKTSLSNLIQEYGDLWEDCRRLDREIAFFRRKAALLEQSTNYSHRSLLAETRKHLGELVLIADRRCASRTDTACLLREALSALPPGTPRDILGYRYLERLTWRQIADLTGLDQRWLFRLHRRTLDALS